MITRPFLRAGQAGGAASLCIPVVAPHVGDVPPEEIQRALQHIEQETDTNVKALLLAALVSEEFRAAGFEPVVVGGSAIEFYTDGAYMSGDTDICWKGAKVPTPVEKAAVLAKFPGAKGSIRSWQIGGLFVDLLGEITTYAAREYTSLQTPYGKIVLQPVEA